MLLQVSTTSENIRDTDISLNGTAWPIVRVAFCESRDVFSISELDNEQIVHEY